MPSFEQEDEWQAAQRAARRARQHLTHAPREFQSDPIKITRAARPTSHHPQDEYVFDDHDVLEEDEDEDEEETRAPRGRHARATPSVSFSEPVETPPTGARRASAADPIEREMALQTPSPSSPSARVARRSRNRLETRLAELQRDVANLSMRLRASSVASHKSASFQEEDDDEENQAAMPVKHHAEDPSTQRSQPNQTRGALNGHREHARGTATNGVPAKSPARTILKKTVVKTSVAAVELDAEPTRRTASSRPRSRSRGRGGGDMDVEDEENSQYRANGRASRPMETSHDHEERPLRVRQSNGQQEQPRSAKEMLRIVRELRVVAVERDQLRYELDQAKRSLAALEKKYLEAAKWREAHDKMKAQCDSLQESLDLSEKIRVRQKRLLQQLQQTVQQDEAAKTRARSHAPSRIDVLDSVLHDTSVAPAQPRRSSTRYMETTRAPSRTVVPTRNAVTKQPNAAVNTSTRSYSRSDFDSLLQVPIPDRSMAGSTVYRRSSQPKKDPVPSRTTTTSRTIHPKPVPTSASNIRSTRQTTTTRSNHFLAPTQSSLSHASKRRAEASRPPFVV